MALRRFHAALIDAMEDRGLDLSRPFTVAEIYQDFVPYRTHRDVLGVEINGDYEHLLLRLLAGEEGLVHLESNAALERVSHELEASNPNTGIFREFAAVDVRLVVAGNDSGSRPSVQLHTDDQGDETEAVDEEPIEIAAFAPTPQPQFQMDSGKTAPAPTASSRSRKSEAREKVKADVAPEAGTDDVVSGVSSESHSSGDSESEDAEGPCRWCRQMLPHRENLNFCPFCGESTSIAPCGSCGEPIEPEWRFCISCGTEAPTG